MSNLMIHVEKVEGAGEEGERERERWKEEERERGEGRERGEETTKNGITAKSFLIKQSSGQKVMRGL